MLLTIPPLWRDVDAYIQVTEPPGVTTILHYCPLYCFLARVPLYLGSAWECGRAGLAWPSARFFVQPELSDSGVWLLVLLQHGALCFASSCLIFAAARGFVARFTLAIFWAANPLFYAFAHCVGTESLSLLLLLFLAIVGLDLVQQESRSRSWRWWLFGLLVALSMLTRHVNGVLNAILPLSFALAGMIRLIAALRTKSVRVRRWLLFVTRKDSRNALIALALSLVVIAVTNATFRTLSRAAGIHYHSRMGYTFMFRLNFFGPLSPAERDPLLQRAAAHSRTTHIEPILSALRAAPSTTDKFDVMDFIRNSGALAVKTGHADDLDDLMNETARAFLISPSREFSNAVAADFTKCLETTVFDVAMQLIHSTAFFFSDPAAMPRVAGLITFRETRSQEILTVLHRRPYFRVWKTFGFERLLVVWFASLLCAAFYRRGRCARLLGYAVSLVVVGLLMSLANSIINEYQPRFTLPMWALTIVSTTLLLGSVTAKKARRTAG